MRRPSAGLGQPDDAKKIHSSIDKVYKRENLEMAWGKGKGKPGS